MKPDELKAWRQRLSLGEAGMAAYLGVPVTTYRKWENGTRSQDASTLRLFEVLRLVEDEQESPGGLHDRLTSKARAAGPADAPKRKPGRKPRASPELTTALNTIANLPAQPNIAATEIPAWMVRQHGEG